MQQVHARTRHFTGRVYFAISILAGFVLCALATGDPANGAAVAKWESNWPQLKKGMTKEQVLALVGMPSSMNVAEGHVTNITSYPPDQKKDQETRETMERLLPNYAIWSYYGTIAIHTTPGEDAKTAFAESANQAVVLSNINPPNGKMQGHAIKFNGAGHIEEISPP
jgi:hypothetical protein